MDPGIVVGEVFNVVTEEALPSRSSNSSVSFHSLENLTCEQNHRFHELLLRNKEIFAENELDLGCANSFEHSIELTSNVPVKTAYRRVPPGIMQEVKDHLREMEQKGIIRPSTSPYSSQMVIVRKRSGQVRICVDYRALNALTIDDAFPLPRIHELVDSLNGAKFFSVLDLASGFHQISIKEEDKYKTAFNTPFGLYEWERVPMGLKTSGACFSRMLSFILKDDLFNEVITYLDDILIYSKTFDEHLLKLERVLNKLQGHGLKLRYEKCDFFKNKVTYVGHLLSEEGISINEEKIKIVKKWKVPETVKELKSFLGFASFL